MIDVSCACSTNGEYMRILSKRHLHVISRGPDLVAIVAIVVIVVIVVIDHAEELDLANSKRFSAASRLHRLPDLKNEQNLSLISWRVTKPLMFYGVSWKFL